MKAIRWIGQIFCDAKGNPSSRRIMSFLLVCDFVWNTEAWAGIGWPFATVIGGIIGFAVAAPQMEARAWGSYSGTGNWSSRESHSQRSPASPDGSATFGPKTPD